MSICKGRVYMHWARKIKAKFPDAVCGEAHESCHKNIKDTRGHNYHVCKVLKGHVCAHICVCEYRWETPEMKQRRKEGKKKWNPPLKEHPLRRLSQQ